MVVCLSLDVKWKTVLGEILSERSGEKKVRVSSYIGLPLT